ncbi:FUSC family protein [Marinitenerispora sediminis]|uniref:FUSC family protein n=1 Tax=Marinitenerispora sediminis TaxID=1931232 RepID=A0A368T0R8_9ACTN|nr:FUSC family protein [Marinitenerispora sediminis]RCV53219.1 FUSC family protein [Marinitenerispora sediminis]RCV56550.1 FUSC family protein [Marinitenerispora sediminis]RCV60133.1 FUSC family protein [Marinitenerispora sediminis]
MRPKVADLPKARIDLKAVFGLASGRWAWTIAIKAAVAMSGSFALAAVFFDPRAAALAALGSMTVLYERTTPYAHRAVALAFVGVGFVLSVGLGSLASVTPWTAALGIGLIAGVATWICQALRVDRPGPLFITLVGAISTIAPGGLAAVPLHAGLAGIGAAVGWLVAMADAPFRGRYPENRAVAEAFRKLAKLLRAVGTPSLDHVQHEASLAVAEAWRLVLLAQTRGYRDTPAAARLRALLRWVSDIHLAAADVSMARTDPLPEEVARFAAGLADAVARPELAPDPARLDEVRRGLRPRSLESRLYTRLARAAQTARKPEHEAAGAGLGLYDTRYPSVLDSLRSSLSRESLVLPTALRMGITVAAAGLLAVLLGFERFYWVSVTTAAVLQGGNVVLTVNRGVQRALGTLLGVVIGVGVLLLHPPLPVVIVAAGLFMGLAQLVIARTFLYGSILLTPMALLIAHTAAPYPVDELAQARILDTLLGSLVGMLGAVLLWRQASASRLPRTIINVLDDARTVINEVLDPDVAIGPERRYRLRRDLRADLISLRGVYDSAIGDVPRAETTQPLWPVVVATQRTGYLALSALALDKPPPVSGITLQRVDLAFRELSAAMSERRAPRLGALPRLVDYPRINMELRALASAMRTAVAGDERAAALEHERRVRREQRQARAEVDADL